MELEYGSDRYDLGNGSHGDHRSCYVYYISLFHIMQRIATIMFCILVLIYLDYFSKQTMLDFLQWEGIQIW